MATTGRKYPTQVGTNTDNWTTPENMLNASDGLCGTKVTGALDWNLKCYLKTFGFNIPIGSTITKLTLGVNACRNMSFGVAAAVSIRLIDGSIEYSSEAQEKQWSSCAGCAEIVTSFLPPIPLPSVATFNNETFTVRVEFAGSSDFANAKTAFCDAVWVEVEYTPPAAVSGVMDGLVQAD